VSSSADTAYRANRAPRMGETIIGNSFKLGPGGKGLEPGRGGGQLGATSPSSPSSARTSRQYGARHLEGSGVKAAITPGEG